MMLAQDYDTYDESFGTLPAGVNEILTSNYVDTFSCEGQEYGYYADIDNNCEVFHVCLPVRDFDNTVIKTQKWSFACPNGTAFDQQDLVCNFKADAFPCDQSASLYGAVDFGATVPYELN